jgi:biotin carboxyl carrier protein
MAAEFTGINEDIARALKTLPELRCFPGAPKDFWPRFLACVAGLTSASHVTLLLRDTTQQPTRWRKLGEWSANAGASRFHTAFVTQLEQIGEQCAAGEKALFPLESAPRAAGHYAVAARLKLLKGDESCIVACLLSEVNEAATREALLRLNLAADTPESYQRNQAGQQARVDVEKFASALDLMVSVNAEKRFLAAALAFCNGIATRYNCDRTSLGWLEAGYIRLRAMSRTEKFDRQMAAAKALEVAMEEALDQDDEVVWPAPEGSTVVTRDHEKFVEEQRVGNIVSLPLRLEKKATAVLACERQGAPFTTMEVQQLRLCCDQAARRLADLKHHDRWFGARWAATCKEKAAKVLGPEHTWAKILAITIVIALAILFFPRFSYRVEGKFILRSDDVAFLTAPFDGYINQVFVRAGDAVTNGSPLLALNTSELELEEASALADLNRFQREAEKARAARALAEMRIAEAMASQSKARLDLVRYRLDRATIKAPFVGVVAEGDLRDRLAAPVKQGEALFKVAKLETLYVEAEVNERDVHDLLGKTRGEIAFVSQPRFKYPVRIVTIEPAGLAKSGENVFIVRCAFEGGPQPWWRPGMSGLCKLDVEGRTLFWIITHRTVDFLRMFLWW